MKKRKKKLYRVDDVCLVFIYFSHVITLKSTLFSRQKKRSVPRGMIDNEYTHVHARIHAYACIVYTCAHTHTHTHTRKRNNGDCRRQRQGENRAHETHACFFTLNALVRGSRHPQATSTMLCRETYS